MPISENDALFTLLGTTFGGDGQETFAMPNLQSRFPMHAGTGPSGTTYQLGESGGTESVTLSLQQIPIHNHPAMAVTNAGGLSSPENALWASTQSGSPAYGDEPNVVGGGEIQMNNTLMQPTGGSQPHENMQPYLVISFIISLFGVFPNP
jgi:microcystin-dependent protein